MIFCDIFMKAQVDQINRTLTREYSLRRQTLLTRLDVTVRSFQWSELGKVINSLRYKANAETQCDWQVHAHVTSDKCNVASEKFAACLRPNGYVYICEI